MHPFAFALSLHQWQLFCTLTFRSTDAAGNVVKVPSAGERKKMLFAFLRETAKGIKTDRAGKRIESVPFPALLWVARAERGERNGRHHFHILFSGLPPSRVNTVERFAIKSIWQGLGGGFSDVRTFDPSLSGVAYVMKGLEQWSIAQANAYEMRKYTGDAEDREVILANACVEKWAQEFTKPRPSEGTRSTVITGASLVGRRKSASSRTNESPALHVLNMHPAGVSVVR